VGKKLIFKINMRSYNFFLIVLGLIFFTGFQALPCNTLHRLELDNCTHVQCNEKQAQCLIKLVQLCAPDEKLSGVLQGLVDGSVEDSENAIFIVAMGTMGCIFCFTLVGLVIVRIAHECIERRAILSIN